MSNLSEIIEKINYSKVLSKNISKKLFIEVIQNKDVKNLIMEALGDIDSLEMCEKCGVIKYKDNSCENCYKKANKVILLENTNEFIELNNEILTNEKFFILNFNKKDYLSFEKINDVIKKLEQINTYESIKEIIISIPYSIETEILVNSLKKNLKDILIKILPIGVSYNSRISLLDKKTLRRAFEKSEEI